MTNGSANTATFVRSVRAFLEKSRNVLRSYFCRVSVHATAFAGVIKKVHTKYIQPNTYKIYIGVHAFVIYKYIYGSIRRRVTF